MKKHQQLKATKASNLNNTSKTKKMRLAKTPKNHNNNLEIIHRGRKQREKHADRWNCEEGTENQLAIPSMPTHEGLELSN